MNVLPTVTNLYIECLLFCKKEQTIATYILYIYDLRDCILYVINFIEFSHFCNFKTQSSHQNSTFDFIFQADPKGTGSIGALDAANFLKKSKLKDTTLSQVN